MDYVACPPSAPIASHVEYLWMVRDAPNHTRERIVPNGTLELVVNLHEDEIRIYDHSGLVPQRFGGAVVSGVYRRYFVIDTREHAAMIGVHFKPGGAGAILGIPAGELADRHVELSALWGALAGELRERLCRAPDSAAAFAILDATLVARLARCRAHPAIPRALAQLACTSIGELARTLGLSRRRLIEVFTADVGVTPKRMSRILRFQRALALAGRGTAWPNVAHASGYFDQAHLIRESNDLAGMTPVELVRASAGVKQHHVAVGEGSNSSNTREPRELMLSPCAPSLSP